MRKESLVYALDPVAAMDEVARAGGRVTHVFTEHLLVIALPDSVSVQSLQHVTTQLPNALEQQEHVVVEAWTSLFGAEAIAGDRFAEAVSAPAIAWDTPGFTPPDHEAGHEGPPKFEDVITESTGTPTSLTLTGSVAVGIVMVSGQPWTRVPGSLRCVSVGTDGTVWGVGNNDEIYRRSGSSWTRMPGAHHQVSIGDPANVWGTNDKDEIYRWNGINTWVRVAGTFKEVSAGGDGSVWAINNDGEIYRYLSNDVWVRMPGSLTQISVGNASSIWGVNGDEIYRWNGTSWTRVPGKLKQVAAAFDGSVFGINKSNEIYRYLGNDNWQQIPGSLRQISALSALLLWGVSTNDAVYTGGASSGLDFSSAEQAKITSEVIEALTFLASAEPVANVTFVYDWRKVSVNAVPGPDGSIQEKYEKFEAPWRNAALAAMGFPASRRGSVDYVSSLRASRKTDWAYVGYFTKYPLYHFGYASGERLVIAYENDNWGPDRINQVFAHESCHIFGAADEYGDCKCDVSGWYRIPNKNCVKCTSSQQACLMNANTLRFCVWSREQIGWSSWVRVDGALQYVSVGADGTVWGVNAGGAIFQRSGSTWKQTPGLLKQISVGNAAQVWGVNFLGEVFTWNGSRWTQVDGSLAHVSVGADGTVWGVNAGDQIFRRAGSTWTKMPGFLKQISVGNDAHVWGVNSSNEVLMWNGSDWTQIAGSLTHVSVASDGTVWGVNAGREIFRRKDDSWQLVTGALSQVSVGAPNRIWGVNAADEVFQRAVLATP
jgi:hypothetical protein